MALKEGKTIYIPEFFEILQNVNERDERIKLINEYCAKGPQYEMTLRFLVEGLWNEKVIFDLPEGDPPYRTNNAPDYTFAPNSLFKAVKNIPRFVKGHSAYIQNQSKRERYFIQQLESLHAKEAKLFLCMKNKKLTGYGKIICLALFKDARPDWFPEETSNTES